MRNRKVKNHIFLLFGLFFGSLCYGQNPVLSKVNGGASWSVAFNKPIIATSSTTDITLDESNYTLVIRHNTAVINLPYPTDARHRVYVLVNNNNSSHSINILSDANGNNGTFTDITSNAPVSSLFSIPAKTSMTVQSNGATWYQIQ